MNKPSPEQLDELRCRISKLHGTWCDICDGTGVTPITGQTAETFEYGGSCDCKPIPNYPEDLNAMHAAEKDCLKYQEDHYEHFIERLEEIETELPIIFAEAWQRAVALDRTLSENPIL